MNRIKKLFFQFEKPSVIVVTGKSRDLVAEVIFQTIKKYFKSRKIKSGALPFIRDKREVLIFETDLKTPREEKDMLFALKRSSSPIFVITRFGDIPPEKDFFAAEKEDTEKARKIASLLPPKSSLVLNFDDETVREIKTETGAKQVVTYGFQERADLAASNISISSKGTNFKLNYRGDSVPFWLDGALGKEHIYSALAASCLGVLKEINLVAVSEAVRNYTPPEGKMRLIDGIKNSRVIDSSDSCDVFSMAESLDILKKIPSQNRKIAVLGDVLGVGKFSIEAHESLGERAEKAADILFAIGLRASFIAQSALIKGMNPQNVFKFVRAKDAKLRIQDEIKEGDLVLVDGAREMHMEEIVKEIRA